VHGRPRPSLISPLCVPPCRRSSSHSSLRFLSLLLCYLCCLYSLFFP
jgi:hypothetical protein